MNIIKTFQFWIPVLVELGARTGRVGMAPDGHFLSLLIGLQLQQKGTYLPMLHMRAIRPTQICIVALRKFPEPLQWVPAPRPCKVETSEAVSKAVWLMVSIRGSMEKKALG